jgi:hypothetical protein
VSFLVRYAVAASLLWTAVQGPPPPGRLPPPGVTATQSATQPVSPVALITWMTRYGSDGVHTLDLIVVWRGNPGWFMRGSQQSSGGGSAGTVRQTLRYGDLQLEVAFHSTKRTADIQGKVVELGDANVILVDHVDSVEGPRVVCTLRIDGEVPSDNGRARVEPVLRRSPEVISFLRCDAPMPDGRGQASIDRLCAQVLGKVPE